MDPLDDRHFHDFLAALQRMITLASQTHFVSPDQFDHLLRLETDVTLRAIDAGVLRTHDATATLRQLIATHAR
jgi:hypothetical protein